MQIGFYYLLDGAVTTVKIADAAVTTTKIADGAVTDAKRTRTPGGIGTADIADGAITDAKRTRTAGGIGTTDIADGAITDAKRTRTPGGISTGDIAAGAITPALLSASYANLAASNTFTSPQQTISGFTDAGGVTLLKFQPTDYGAGKPLLSIYKQGAGEYSLDYYDGTTNDVGTLNFLVGTVVFQYAVTVQNATASQNPVPKGQADADYISTAAGSVGTTNLAASAVTTAKIADANVTSGKLAAGVALANLADQSITDALVQLLNRKQLFTADGTFTAPHTGTYWVIAVGGGSGGGAGGGTSAGSTHGGSEGMPGASGALYITSFALNAGATVAVTVGSGGAGGSGVSGGDGGRGLPGTATVIGTTGSAAGGLEVWGGIADYTFQSEGRDACVGMGLGGGSAGGGGVSNANGSSGGDGSTGTGSGGGGGGGAGAGATQNTGGNGGQGASGFALFLW